MSEEALREFVLECQRESASLNVLAQRAMSKRQLVEVKSLEFIAGREMTEADLNRLRTWTKQMNTAFRRTFLSFESTLSQIEKNIDEAIEELKR